MRAILIAFIVLFSFSCKKDSLNNDKAATLTDWIQMREGNRWLYKVDSIAYSRNKSIPDTFSFELMEMVDTVYADNIDELVARIKIVTRKDSLDFWQFRKMYYAKTTQNYYERVEENLRYLKVSFPPAEDVVWNLNSRNNLPPAMLYYRNLFEPYQGTDIKFDTTFSVVGKEISNVLEKYKYLEVYGKGIGLIYRENTQMLNQGGNWDGYKRIQKLVYAD